LNLNNDPLHRGSVPLDLCNDSLPGSNDSLSLASPAASGHNQPP